MDEYLNYTHIEAVYGKKYNLAPRLYRGLTGFHEAPGSSTNFTKDSTFVLLDTVREKEIGVGDGYPFGPLGPGECIISEEFKEGTDIGVGSEITVNLFI